MNRRHFLPLCAATLGLSLSFGALSAQAQTPASKVPALVAAEKSRGVFSSRTGVKWTVNVESKTTSGTKKAKFTVISQQGNVRAEILEPADSADRRYVINSSGMWFHKGDLSRPVSVSRRQRLSGDAAIGDIASNSLIDGYQVSGQETATVNGKKCDVFTLTSSDKSATYAKVKYWVTQSDQTGIRAEYYATSGNLLRSAEISYGNSVSIDGQRRPFLSRAYIIEGNKTRVVTLQFSGVQIGDFPDSLFDHKLLK